MLNIIEELRTDPKAMGLLRSFAKSQGISIQECFAGTATKDKIALLNSQEIKKLKSEGAFMVIDKKTSGKLVGRKISKMLGAYLNE